MKQSLIITMIICLFLGESFSIITKNDLQQKNKKVYCCSKICEKAKLKGANDMPFAEPYLPMLNMLGYN